MKKVFFSSAALLLLGLVLFQCAKGGGDPLASLRPNLPNVAFNYTNLTAPDGRQTNAGTFSVLNGVGFSPNNMAVTNAGAALGRVLFYDIRLSINRTVACASCHHQETAFSDEGKKGSTGMSGLVTPRNSSSITNVAFKNNLFWDSRVQSLPDLVGKPVSNHIEMGMESLDQVARRLAQVEFYPALFEEAFGDKKVTASRIESAMSQFLASMISSNSKYDAGVKTNFSNFTALEKQGKDLFFSQETKCNTCHAAPLFSSPDAPFVGYYGDDKRGAANIGLDNNYADLGFRLGEFCIPSLRNIALSPPYMHDGRFNTLAEVINHYSEGIKANNDLDFNLTTNAVAGGTPKKMNFTPIQKDALLAFLNTLTDQSVLNDPKFSDPFK
jgi:cytochrome c peroxidase